MRRVLYLPRGLSRESKLVFLARSALLAFPAHNDDADYDDKQNAGDDLYG